MRRKQVEIVSLALFRLKVPRAPDMAALRNSNLKYMAIPDNSI